MAFKAVLEFGTVTSFNCVQPKHTRMNKYRSMMSIRKCTRPENVKLPILCTESGKVTFVRLIQPILVFLVKKENTNIKSEP